MLYRKILLLALTQACGGSASVATCQATLSLFCTLRKKDHYEFFPSPQGYLSLVLAQDKRSLIQAGLLAKQEGFVLQQEDDYLTQLKPEDQEALLTIIKETNQVLQSQLFSRRLELEEKEPARQKEASSSQKEEHQANSPCLFTLGYEGLSIDAYLKLLIASDVAVLVDVRRNPLSRKYGFSKQQLIQATRLAGIAYQHIPELGIPSSLRQHLDNEAAYERLFAYYATSLLPEQKAAIEQVKHLLSENHRIVLMCFEAAPRFCHRHKIVEYLQTDATFHTPVVHLNKGDLAPISSTMEIAGMDVPIQMQKNSLYIHI